MYILYVYTYIYICNYKAIDKLRDLVCISKGVVHATWVPVRNKKIMDIELRPN